MKKLALFIIAVAAIIATVIIIDSIPKHDEEEIELFEIYRDDFELITEYIIQNFDSETRNSILVEFTEDGKVELYDNGDIYPEQEIQKAFNKILNAFKHYEFSFVDITPERVSYGGLGYRMYVYSRDGKVPDYFYHKGDRMDEDRYYLGDNWYLLKVNFI